MSASNYAVAIGQDAVRQGLEVLERYMASQVPVLVTTSLNEAGDVSSTISGDPRHVGFDALERFIDKQSASVSAPSRA